MADETMKGEEAIRFLGDLQRIDMKPGDRFVLKVDRALTQQQCEHLRKAWRGFVGNDAEDMQLLILDAGMEIGIIGKAE